MSAPHSSLEGLEPDFIGRFEAMVAETAASYYRLETGDASAQVPVEYAAKVRRELIARTMSGQYGKNPEAPAPGFDGQQSAVQDLRVALATMQSQLEQVIGAMGVAPPPELEPVKIQRLERSGRMLFQVVQRHDTGDLSVMIGEDGPRKTNWYWPIAAVAAVMVLAMGLVFFAPSAVAQPLQGVIPLPTPISRVTHNDLAPGARESLRHFLEAKTVDEKLPWVVDPQRVAAAMRTHYQLNPLENVRLRADAFAICNSIDPADAERGITGLECLSAGRGGQPLMAFFRMDARGVLRLDWEFFVQLSEGTFRQFVRAPEVGRSGVFRVGFRKVPVVAEGKHSVPVRVRLVVWESPDDSVLLEAEPSSSDLVAALGTGLEWGQDRTATVDLTWVGDETSGKPVMALTRLICWESLGLGDSPRLDLSGTIIAKRD